MTTKAEMTSRERVMAILSLQEPDRVPIDFAQAGGDGITAVAYQRLIDHLELPPREGRIMNKMAQSVHVEEDVLQRFRVDFRRLDMGPPDNWKDEPVGDNGYRDEWGVVRVRPKGSYYYDLAESPITDDTMDAIDRHPWPDPEDPGRYRGLREKARELHEETDYAVIMGLGNGVVALCQRLRGFAEFMEDVMVQPNVAEAFMERVTDTFVGIALAALREAGQYCNVVNFAEDLGIQDRPYFRPELYRSRIKPYHRRMIEAIKSGTSAKMVMHSDGAIYPIIPDLIDIGVDAINPVQVSAKWMGDTKRLKAEFGEHLGFWGSIDTHRVLPFGTPEDVDREVRTRIGELAPGGGYVLGSVHEVRPEVPAENIVAMFEAARKYGSYEHLAEG